MRSLILFSSEPLVEPGAMVFGCQYLQIIGAEPDTSATRAFIKRHSAEGHRFDMIAALRATVQAVFPDKLLPGGAPHLLDLFFFLFQDVQVFQSLFPLFPDVSHSHPVNRKFIIPHFLLKYMVTCCGVNPRAVGGFAFPAFVP